MLVVDPPREAIEALMPIARPVTALAVVASVSAGALRQSIRDEYPPDFADRLIAQSVGTGEACGWTNAVDAFVESHPELAARSIREHSSDWVTWEVAGKYQLRIERRRQSKTGSLTREAFNRQLNLDELLGLDSPRVLRPEEATNIVGTMVRGHSGQVTAVRFHAPRSEREDLWGFNVKAEEVRDLPVEWADDDLWVKLARLCEVMALGSPAATWTRPDEVNAIASSDEVRRRVAPGANPILPPSALPAADMSSAGRQEEAAG